MIDARGRPPARPPHRFAPQRPKAITLRKDISHGTEPGTLVPDPARRRGSLRARVDIGFRQSIASPGVPL